MFSFLVLPSQVSGGLSEWSKVPDSNIAIYRSGIIHFNMYRYHCVAKLIHHAKHDMINDS